MLLEHCTSTYCRPKICLNKLPQICLKLFSRQKYDGRTDGQADRRAGNAATIMLTFGQHKINYI